MKDKTNNRLINHLKNGQNKNTLFRFLISKFEDDTEQSYDLNIKEYVTYKNTRKEGDDIDKEEEVEIDCAVKINNFFPYYYRATTRFSDIKDVFNLALCHYISSGSGDGPTFEQFLFYHQSIEKNNVVEKKNSECITVTETIDDMFLINKREKINPKKY